MMKGIEYTMVFYIRVFIELIIGKINNTYVNS